MGNKNSNNCTQLIIYALAVLAKTKYFHYQLIKIWLFQNVNVGTTEKNH